MTFIDSTIISVRIGTVFISKNYTALQLKLSETLGVNSKPKRSFNLLTFFCGSIIYLVKQNIYLYWYLTNIQNKLLLVLLTICFSSIKPTSYSINFIKYF